MTDRAQRLVNMIKEPELRAQVMAKFQSGEQSERIRFAVIKLATRGERAFELAAKLHHTDWRDLLVEAEFADDIHAHEQWCDEMLKEGDV